MPYDLHERRKYPRGSFAAQNAAQDDRLRKQIPVPSCKEKIAATSLAGAGGVPLYILEVHRADHVGGQIVAAREVNPKRVNGADRTPGNAPPAHQQGQQSPWQSFHDAIFFGAYEVDIS